MSKTKYAAGKAIVAQRICSICGSSNCEESIRRDIDCPKGIKRVTYLCYDCGAYNCTPPVK